MIRARTGTLAAWTLFLAGFAVLPFTDWLLWISKQPRPLAVLLYLLTAFLFWVLPILLAVDRVGFTLNAAGLEILVQVLASPWGLKDLPPLLAGLVASLFTLAFFDPARPFWHSIPTH